MEKKTSCERDQEKATELKRTKRRVLLEANSHSLLDSRSGLSLSSSGSNPAMKYSWSISFHLPFSFLQFFEHAFALSLHTVKLCP